MALYGDKTRYIFVESVYNWKRIIKKEKERETAAHS